MSFHKAIIAEGTAVFNAVQSHANLQFAIPSMSSIVISLISGVLLSLAFPRTSIHWLAWFALAPLMYYTYRLSWRRALICAAAFGLGFFASLLHWIGIFGRLPWAALSVFQCLFIVAFVAAAKLIGSRLGSWGRFALPPALWVGFEWIRSLGMFGFTWGDLGYSQYKVLPIVQLASLTGVWGVSLLIALSNSALASLAAARGNPGRLSAARIQIILVGIAILSAAALGLASLRRPAGRTGEPIRAAVIQGNINQDAEQDVAYRDRTWRTYRTMTLAAEKADLIVWPETVVPGCAGRDPYIQRRLTDLAAGVRAHLLVGGWDENNKGGDLNTAFLIGPGSGVLGRYAKVRLVPFGEFVPLRRYMPFLQYYRVTPMDVSPGPGYNLLDAGSYKLGTAICFESIFPDISRRLTASGAELLCVITNDAWFGRTSAAEQHLSKSVFRAVENRRYLIRAAATGISCIVDPHGRILSRAGLFRPEVLHADVRARAEKTFYTRHGDWLVYACLALAGFLAVIAITRNPGRKNVTIANHGGT